MRPLVLRFWKHRRLIGTLLIEPRQRFGRWPAITWTRFAGGMVVSGWRLRCWGLDVWKRPAGKAVDAFSASSIENDPTGNIREFRK